MELLNNLMKVELGQGVLLLIHLEVIINHVQINHYNIYKMEFVKLNVMQDFIVFNVNQ